MKFLNQLFKLAKYCIITDDMHFNGLQLFFMFSGLFNRVILQSGSAFCHWSYTENVAQKTKHVANMMGCPTNNSVDTVKCLRSRPGISITKSIVNFMVVLFLLIVQ